MLMIEGRTYDQDRELQALARDDLKLILMLERMEKHMSQLDTDVATLTAAVTTLQGVVATVVTTLQGIVDTSSDDAAVVAATAALTSITTSLQGALPAAPVVADPSTPDGSVPSAAS